MRIDDDTLAAWADGALDPAEAAEIEAAATADAVLAERLRRAKRSGARRAARAGHATPELVDLASVRAQRRRPVRAAQAAAPWRKRIALALVAVAVGFGLLSLFGRLPRPGAAPPLAVSGGRVTAEGDLARALTTEFSARQSAKAPYRVLSSFRAADGAWCRSFEARDLRLAGAACREGGRWRLRTLYDPTRSAQGQVVDATGEARARANGWAR